MLRENLYVATIGKNAVNLASEYGLGIELDHICLSNNMDGEDGIKTLETMKEDMKSAGILGESPAEKLTGGNKAILHGPFTELHPAAIDPKARALAKERLTQAIEIAKSLEIHNMVVHSGYMPFVYFKDYHIEKSAEFWVELMENQPEDISLSIENVLEDEPYMMAKMLDAIRKREAETHGNHRYGICLDVGHAACRSQVPVTEWIKVLGDRITHCHLHNNDGSGDFHAVFDCENAVFDMAKVLEAFEKYGFEHMTYTIEALEPGPCLQWLKDNS